MSNVRPTQIVFVGTHRWNTYSIFNLNAFPDYTKVIVDASGLRLALFSLHVTSLSQTIQRDRTEFIGSLERQRQDMERALTNHPDHICVAMYDGLAYLSQMHSCLNTLKSFLDIYAKLIGKLIRSQNEWSFNKANIDGVKLAGGRLINALRNCSNATFANDLATLTLNHSRDWITTAVAYRDQLSHRSDLNHMTHMQMPLYNEPPHFRENEIVEPRMPNGDSVLQYFLTTQESLLDFIRRSIVLLPNVDANGINPEHLGKR